MTSEEKYYRRTYSLLNDLIDAYNNGFHTKEILSLWKKSIVSYRENPILFNEKRQGLILTIIIALLGLNKESIERAEIVGNYKGYIKLDYRNFVFNKTISEKMLEFENLRTKNSIFDNWLFIKQSPSSDISARDVLRRVRNGLLHSNFWLETFGGGQSFTHIKTKSYYESTILNENFFQFVFAYFSNIPTLGLSEKTLVYYADRNLKIKNKENLREHLRSIKLFDIPNSVEDYNGNNSLGHRLARAAKEKHPNRNIITELNKSEANGITLKDLKGFFLKDESIDVIIDFLEKNFQNFYSFSEEKKRELIVAHLEYVFENKRQISNWLFHFYCVTNNVINPNFNVDAEVLKEDEDLIESLKPSLAILKGYLIMYRLQNEVFDVIDYDKVDLDFDNNEMWFWCENKEEYTEENYYEVSFNKKKKRASDMSDTNIEKSIICEVIRNGFAHGNITCFTDDKSGRGIIEIKDIDRKNDRSRCIQMTIEKFNKFLSSEAFLPKYCFNKELLEEEKGKHL